MSQRRGKRTSNDRRVAKLAFNQTFLIVCEGEKTEPNYFKAFPTPTDVIIEVVGEGYNTLSLVKRAAELAKEQSYDQVWCVFDRDSCHIETFNAAIELAKRKGFRVAYSNEAFELWYLLHFHYYQTSIPRRQYCELLTDLLCRPYKKNDRSIYKTLLDRQPAALANAERLLAIYDPPNPARDNPSTKVHLLVRELNKYTRDRLLRAVTG